MNYKSKQIYLNLWYRNHTEMRKLYGIFVAGGSGTRMGGDIPKQFLELEGIPVLQRTISKFHDALPEMTIITVLPKKHFSSWKDLCVKHEFNVPQILVAGGITRFHSVQNALAHVPDGALVMIHDGVRPLISESLIRSLSQAAQDVPALIPAIPMVDTLKYVDGRYPDPLRSEIVGAQTPQCFWSEVIKQSYCQAFDPAFTDDASVAQANKIPLSITDGERFNIKITTPEDLPLAEFLISTRNL